MYKIYHTDKSKFIAYKHYKSNKKNMPTIIFLHGLMSDMTGTKACYLESYCQNRNYNFIAFDNFGHGKSTGDFLSETIGSWLLGVQLVLDQLVENDCIIVGSSMGGWLG